MILQLLVRFFSEPLPCVDDEKRKVSVPVGCWLGNRFTRTTMALSSGFVKPWIGNKWKLNFDSYFAYRREKIFRDICASTNNGAAMSDKMLDKSEEKWLMVVESPAKASTIAKYLGPNFNVVASYGHVRDLPAKQGSVLPEKNFQMKWEIPETSRGRLEAIKNGLKEYELFFIQFFYNIKSHLNNFVSIIFKVIGLIFLDFYSEKYIKKPHNCNGFRCIHRRLILFYFCLFVCVGWSIVEEVFCWLLIQIEKEKQLHGM